MNKIVIVDYKMGNLKSVMQALQHVAPKANVCISDKKNIIKAADRIVLPGQGAMPDCMSYLYQSGLKDTILEVARNKPLLGICIGKQILFDWSEEGNTHGLGLLAGKIIRFKFKNMLQQDGSRFKVPHIGWNNVYQNYPHPLWTGINNLSYFYFIHSYYVQPVNAQYIAGQTQYGHNFVSAVTQDNIFATQFHPEKSDLQGLQLYRNFVTWKP